MSEDLKTLCIEHGKTLERVVVLIEEGNKQHLTIFDKLKAIPKLDKRIVVLETKEATQPSAKRIMTFASIAGGMTTAMMWIAKRLL